MSLSETRSILIVDDEILCLELLSMIVKDWGFNVVEASSGEEAASKMNQHIYKVITDMHMGDGKMTGNDVAKVAKKKIVNIGTILLFSPFKVEPDLELFDHVLRKPVNFKELERVLLC